MSIRRNLDNELHGRLYAIRGAAEIVVSSLSFIGHSARQCLQALSELVAGRRSKLSRHWAGPGFAMLQSSADIHLNFATLQAPAFPLLQILCVQNCYVSQEVGIALRLSEKENSEIGVSGKPFLNSFFDITNKHASKNLNSHNSPCLPDIKNSGIVGL